MFTYILPPRCFRTVRFGSGRVGSGFFLLPVAVEPCVGAAGERCYSGRQTGGGGRGGLVEVHIGCTVSRARGTAQKMITQSAECFGDVVCVSFGTDQLVDPYTSGKNSNLMRVSGVLPLVTFWASRGHTFVFPSPPWCMPSFLSRI